MNDDLKDEGVVIFRLLTGEEIIGLKIKHYNPSVSNQKIRIKKPATVIVTPPTGPGRAPNIGLAPFVPYFLFKNEIVDFREEHIVFIGTPDLRLEEGYRKVNGMLLTGESKGLIIP